MIGSAVLNRVAALCCAGLLLSACSSTTETSSTPPGLGSGNGYTWNVRITNTTDRYVLVTRYWSYGVSPAWAIEGANCLAPHDKLDTSIEYSINTFPEAKLRAEVKRSTNSCRGDTLPNGDFYGNKCSLNFGRQAFNVIGGTAELKEDSGAFSIPTDCDPGS